MTAGQREIERSVRALLRVLEAAHKRMDELGYAPRSIDGRKTA